MESWGGEGEWSRAAFFGVLACCLEGPALKGGGGARREGTPGLSVVGLKVAFIEGRGLKGDTARGEDMRVKGAGIWGARIVGDGVWKAKL